MDWTERELVEVGIEAEGFFLLPSTCRAAVLVLSGSSGRVEIDRARAFAGHGVAAIAMRWFGGPHQPPGICEVPLETFTPAVDHLCGHADLVGILGASKGAEAALLVAAHDPRVRVVTAVSPPSVVFANVGAGTDGHASPDRSSWTRGGVPLPFVSYDRTSWPADDQAPAFRELYLRSLDLDPARTERATIPVEQIAAALIVTAGADDQVWPVDVFCDHIVARRRRHGLHTDLIAHRTAGHRPLFPGEQPPRGGQAMARGGDEQSDREHGAAIWGTTLRALGAVPSRED